MTTPAEAAVHFTDHRVELSGEDEAPNMGHLIDKELQQAFLAGVAWVIEFEKEIASAPSNRMGPEDMSFVEHIEELLKEPPAASPGSGSFADHEDFK